MKKLSTFLTLVMLACMHASSLPKITTPTFTYSPSSAGEQIRSNLYSVASDASTTLLDGSITQYDPTFTNAIDGMDARKMSNFSENLGMIRGTTTLVIERRHTIDITDTIFFKLWNVQQKTYQLEFITSNLNHPGLKGLLVDSYTHTSVGIDLDGTNNINFSVNADPASANIFRFKIIFVTVAQGILPLTFTSEKAYQKNNTNIVSWTTANESNMKSYTIQKSVDGKHFNNESDVAAGNLAVNNYGWTDALPAGGFNYYRILSTDISGATKYSDIVKVFTGKETGDIKVFPNPVTDNTIHMQIVNQPEGQYELRLINSFGQCVMAKQIQHAEGTSAETIRPSQVIPKGIYQLEITKPGGSKMNIHLVY